VVEDEAVLVPLEEVSVSVEEGESGESIFEIVDFVTLF
jgi:hypothetical protein